jgi:ABC-type multidrug transport system fused ATPase/permease subunit
MFTGTLRFNVDPRNTISDDEIKALLIKAGLENLLSRYKPPADGTKKGETAKNELDFEITENGGNLSSGEKQLICICRAILRKNKIILLDEATANIDIVTEQKIQSLITEEFGQCTVITIAHRLQTIIESDKVMVLGDGRVLEFDTPQELLKN